MLCCLIKESLDKNKKMAKLQNTPQLISASLTCVGRLWRSRHNTIDAILIQWHVNELRGILKLLRFLGILSRVWALSLISVFTRRQGKKIPSANATKQTKVQLKPHPLSLLRALIQVSKKKKKRKKKERRKTYVVPLYPSRKRYSCDVAWR